MLSEIPKYSTQQELDEDIEYFRNKLKFTFDAAARAQMLKQIAVLEDIVLTHPITKTTREEAYDEKIKPDSY